MGARFVRLGIAGFKSFADATSIEILPGLTGIVGPNGCGKSNVAEALRWAMGEANARHLRGGEMDDIIFAGTANRPSRNLAEVCLTIESDEGEDGKGGLPSPFTGQSEVQVVRRIERGGGSAYRVNGREARARDVQTLFADLASGARSSAMVSQGRVGALVGARPEERRAVLEEAAGITGLHARRAEAETRLRSTEANLERAEERRVQLAKQLDSLLAQARQAGRYRSVATALQDTEALLLAIQRERATMARDAAQRGLEAARAAVMTASAAAETAVREADETQAALPPLRQAASDAAATVERMRMALGAQGAELERARAAIVGAEQRIGQLGRDLAYARSTLDQADAVDRRLVDEAGRLTVEAAEHPALLAAAEAEAGQASRALREADAAAVQAAAEAGTAAAQAQAAQQARQQAEARHRRAADTAERAKADLEQAAAKLVAAERVAEAEEAQATASAACVVARSECARAEQDHAVALKSTAAAREAFHRLDAAHHRLAAEAGALSDVLGIRDGEKWPPMVDSLNVPAGLETALGAALGEELAAAANPDAARHWQPLPPLPCTAIPGARLSDTVGAPPLLARALGAIGLVQTEAEGAAAQAELSPGQCVVSPQGGVWRWDGYTIRSGTPNAAAVRLQQRNRLKRLRQELGESGEAREAAKLALDGASRAEREATGAVDRCRQQLRRAESDAERARAAAQALQLQTEAARVRHETAQRQFAQVQPEAEAAAAALQAVLSALAAQPDVAALQARAQASQATVQQARQRDLAASRALDSLQRAGEGRMARLATIGRERDDRRMRAADLTGRVTDLEARLAEAMAEAARLGDMPARLQQEAETARAALSAAEAGLAGARQALSEAEALAAGRVSAARVAEQAGFGAREALVRAEGALDVADQALEAALARVAERESALPPLPEAPECSAAAEDRARMRLSRLAKERDEIGPVNLRAEIEAAEIEAEVATIIREADELATAIAKLRGSIGHLNREGRERLSAVFQTVDRHFQALFSRMFGGGRAHLALVGSDDPLQAGLEIYAQPPGKKLAALSLLSGGEQALTALSLIFAVFRCNPAPLCILDEVDAPLDDANVGRFCALLADMVQETGTRFLVVTHHQVTMAAMDRLYGVTMQERGVSRLLSVDLSRAVDLIEAVAAE